MKGLSSLIVLVLLPVTFASGANVKPEKLVKEYRSALEQLQGSEKKQRKILSQLYNINRQLKAETQKRSELEQKKEALQARVKAVAKDYLEIKKTIAAERRKLISRIRLLATVGAKDFARVLVTSNSAAEIDRNLYMIAKVAGRDLGLISGYRQSLEDLVAKRNELEEERAAFDQIALDHEKAVRQLEEQQKNRFGLVSKIRASKKQYLARLQDYRSEVEGMQEEDRKQIADLILQPSFFEQRGKLAYPVGGRRTNIQPVNPSDQRVALNSKGVFIQADVGVKARAVFRSEVSYADFVPGYRGLVVLSHGDNYYSVLGNLDQIFVSEGQKLAEGENVGSVGPQRWRTHQGVYFEIRHFSEPEDPAEWLSGAASFQLTRKSEKESSVLQ